MQRSGKPEVSSVSGSCFLFPGILGGRDAWQQIKRMVVLGTWEAGTQEGRNTWSQQTVTSPLLYRTFTLLLLLVGYLFRGFLLILAFLESF